MTFEKADLNTYLIVSLKGLSWVSFRSPFQSSERDTCQLRSGNTLAVATKSASNLRLTTQQIKSLCYDCIPWIVSAMLRWNGAPYRDAEHVSIHRWFFIHDRVLVAINPLPVYGLTLEHAWNTIRREKRERAKRRVSNFRRHRQVPNLTLHLSALELGIAKTRDARLWCDISVFFLCNQIK